MIALIIIFINDDGDEFVDDTGEDHVDGEADHGDRWWLCQVGTFFYQVQNKNDQNSDMYFIV